MSSSPTFRVPTLSRQGMVGESIRDVPQAKTMGWGKLPSPLAVSGPDDLGHLPRLLAARAHLHQGADHRPHHLVAEGVGLDLEPQQALVDAALCTLGAPALCTLVAPAPLGV